MPKKSFEMSTQEFWEEIQKNIPEGQSISWHELFARFGRSGTGLHVIPLVDQGFIKIDFKGSISINENKRNQKSSV